MPALRTDVPGRPLPVLPLRGIDLHPGSRRTLTLGVKGRRAIDSLDTAHGPCTVVAVRQHDPTLDDPGAGDLAAVGTLARVVDLTCASLDDEPSIVTIEGLERVRVLDVLSDEPALRARVTSRREGSERWPGDSTPGWNAVDEASWESFPASDPPAWYY